MIFSDFDFNRLSEDSFKESDVREEIIMPLLIELGYKGKNIVREMNLKTNTVREGSKSKAILIFPDYVLKNDDKIICVLDAKSPSESLTDNKYIGQIFSYSSHPEIQSPICVLCNGKQLAVFKIPDYKPVLLFNISETDVYFEQLHQLIAPQNSFQKPLPKIIIKDYMNLELPYPILKPQKQKAKRHFGVHGYFTKQSWDIVQKHIETFSSPQDMVLDPFGGSGVTFTEALITGRKSVHIDLNPLSVFWVSTLFTEVSQEELNEALKSILKQFDKNRPKTDKDIQKLLTTLAMPKNIIIQEKGSDVKTLFELFTDKQRAELALLKSLIQKQKVTIKNCLMLAFSSTLTQNNLTYHNSTTRENYGGDSGIFRYYRYRLAPTPIELDVAHSFQNKIKKLMNALNEIRPHIHKKILDESRIIKGDATQLPIDSESVDYIYTDPPYGNKIPYLDLSAMWNAWLDFEVTEEDYQKEAIEGGSHNKSSEDYQDLITKSIKEMFRVLKWDRWLSFVFQHQSPKYWHLIVDSAEKIGFEYAGSVRYTNGQTSFKKRQNPFSVLSGQLIIYFKKRKNPKTLLKHDLGGDIVGAINNNIEALIAKEHGATLEEIYNELIINGLELGFLDVLSKEYPDLTPLLREHFDYDNETEKYHIKKNTKFKAHIPVDMRIRYFLRSYLQRKNRENIYPNFDDIILDIMPMLKNGTTPKYQTIQGVLDTLASKYGDGWQLEENKKTLFD